MNYNFYTKMLCALITCASMGLVASEITADKVIVKVEQVTNKKITDNDKKTMSKAIEWTKETYKNEFNTILQANDLIQLKHAINQLKNKNKNNASIIGESLNPIFPILERLIANAQIKEPQQIKPRKKNSKNQTFSDKETKKIKTNHDAMFAEQEANFLNNIKKNNQNNWKTKLTSYGLILATGIICGYILRHCYNYYKK